MLGTALAGRLALAAGALVVLCAAVGAAGRPAAAGPTSRIVFAADRLPLWDGEVFRVTAAGRRIDLSRSPAADVEPVVSPDGRWVAFLSARGGVWALWVVGIDGGGLRRVSASFFRFAPAEEPSVQIAWAPNSRALAAAVASGAGGSTLYVGARTASVHRVTGGSEGESTSSLVWAPDGRFLAYPTTFGEVDVVTPAGKRVWTTSGTVAPAAWSADDRLAVSSVRSTVSVFDARGLLLTRFAGITPSWSSDGRLLASDARFAVEIRTGGVGHPVARWPGLHLTQLEWIGSDRLRALGQAGWVGYDVVRRTPWTPTGAATLVPSVVSAGGEAVGVSSGSVAAGTSLLRSRAGSSATTTIARAPYCGEDGSFGSLALVPHGGGVVYELICDAPSADLYSVAPDGSHLRRLTHTPEDETQPSLSPDGRTVVYVQAPYAARCDGCALTLWSVPAAGGEPRRLTSHTDTDPSPYDMNPAWSPDGSEIVFENSGTDQSRLMTMPATGGTPRTLGDNGDVLPVWTRRGIVALDWRVRTFRAVLIDPATGGSTIAATGKAPDPEALAVSRDGRLAYLYVDGRGRASVGVAGSSAKPLDLSALLPASAHVAGLAWSPDDTRFAFAADDANGIGEIWTVGVDGRGLRQLTRNLGAIDFVATLGTLSWR